ncbi:molybdenum cofactor guanylyltransferase MobA [Sulfurimonas sp. SAG-AH-194-C20]|nr:molybdenum cofactor guanylyltransferase MobA [Sulfurimonas sp. SAG-AH-194-C20]MDF1878055.1 molybdenum cofactor guanylyltransferase MobA [Sulfurimonas sp. SAG-AH-194-C20]
MLNIPCVIFAGGKSSRMGEDKALLPFAGFKTLTEYQHSRLSKIFTNVYISCKDKSKFNFSANFIEDETATDLYAPTAGFIATYKVLQNMNIFVLSVDSPFIDNSIIQTLCKEHTKSFEATLAKTKHGLEPLCGIYSVSLEKKFIAMKDKNSHKLGQMLQSSHIQTINFDDTIKFLNLNYKKDYLQAMSLL